MIYSVHWMGLANKIWSLPSYFMNSSYDGYPEYNWVRKARGWADKSINLREFLAEYIKESKEDSFVFILVNSQINEFNLWLTEKGLEEYVAYRMERPVTNGNHPQNGRNLTLVVMASKEHVWRDMFDPEIEWSNV